MGGGVSSASPDQPMLKDKSQTIFFLVSALKVIGKKEAKSNETSKILIGPQAPSPKEITYKRLAPPIVHHATLTTPAPSVKKKAADTQESTEAPFIKKNIRKFIHGKRPRMKTRPMTPPIPENSQSETTKAPSVKKDLRKRVAPSTTPPEVAIPFPGLGIYLFIFRRTVLTTKYQKILNFSG